MAGHGNVTSALRYGIGRGDNGSYGRTGPSTRARWGYEMRNIVLAVCAVVACLGQARAAATTDVIYDGLGNTEKGGGSFATGGTVMLDRVVNTAAGTLKSVVLTVKLGKADLGSFRVVGALAGSGGLPGGLATPATISDRSLKVGKWHNLRVTPTTSLTLKAKTGYFVGQAAMKRRAVRFEI